MTYERLRDEVLKAINHSSCANPGKALRDRVRIVDLQRVFEAAEVYTNALCAARQPDVAELQRQLELLKTNLSAACKRIADLESSPDPRLSQRVERLEHKAQYQHEAQYPVASLRGHGELEARVAKLEAERYNRTTGFAPVNVFDLEKAVRRVGK
jgi:hypothetical protein